MSTRSAIARPTDMGWEGRYHHWDGYPTALGATLHELHATVFGGDTSAMQRVLIDDHPGGWSTINGADWSQEPGFIEYGVDHTDEEKRRPNCYCHGDRSEGPFPTMLCHCESGAPVADGHQDCDPLFIEYAYVITDMGLELWHNVLKDGKYVHRRWGLVSWNATGVDWGDIEADMAKASYGEVA